MKIISLALLLLLLVNTSWAQNTKGDKPESDRGSRFSKTDKKSRSVKRKQDKKRVAHLKSYKPRKQAKGGEQAGQAVGHINNGAPRETKRPSRSSSGRTVRPSSATGKHKNVYPASGRYVHNNSKKPKNKQEAAPANGSYVNNNSSKPRSNQKVTPASGRYVHNNSRKPKPTQQPVSNKSTLSRLARLQSREKPPGRKIRVTPRSASQSFTARKSINVMAQYPRPRQKTEKAYTRDIAGRKLRTKNFETKRPGVTAVDRSRRLSVSGRKRSTDPGGRHGRFRNFSSRGRSSSNVYPQSGKFVGSYNKSSRTTERGQSNRATLARLKSLQSKGNPPGKKRKIVPRSASGSFIARRSTNTWAHFPRPKRKGERAHTGDITGRPIRGKNYETPRPGIIQQGKINTGIRRADRPYRGPSGGFISRTKPTEQPWRGDIAGRSIRGIKKPKSDTAGKMFGAGSGTSPRRREVRPGRAIPARAPGIGANGMRGFKGNIKGKRPTKGGGSVSGKLWNNNGNPLNGRVPGIGADRVGDFQGNIKGKRPSKGGGSVSGKLWNNNQRPVDGRAPGRGADGVGEFQGNIKTRRPEKGGGSVSGKLWNNRETPIEVRTPGEGTQRAGKYEGDIRLSRFKKAYIKNPNTVEDGLAKRRPSKPVYDAGGLQVKVARRPYKKNENSAELSLKKLKPTESTLAAGGLQTKVARRRYSKNPNSNDLALKKLSPSQSTLDAGGLQQKVARRRYVENPNSHELALKKLSPSQSTLDAGGLQQKVARRRYVENPNSHDLALKKLAPSQSTLDAGGLQQKVARRRYIINPNSHELALKKLKPSEATLATGGLQTKVARRRYVKNPNSAELALLKLEPTKATRQAGGLQIKVRQYNYIHNRSSNENALKVREPGKAFARATDYQGNIRMQKFKLFDKHNRELHPDARFVKINKNNVAEEKDAITNLKLWWARLFKKNETQPDHLKEKGKKPRYDKGEAGMWYD